MANYRYFKVRAINDGSFNTPEYHIWRASIDHMYTIAEWYNYDKREWVKSSHLTTGTMLNQYFDEMSPAEVFTTLL